MWPATERSGVCVKGRSAGWDEPWYRWDTVGHRGHRWDIGHGMAMVWLRDIGHDTTMWW